MNQIGSTTVTTLLKETESESERTTGWIRIVLAVALAASLLVSGRIAAAAGYADIWGRLGLGALAIGALLALGIVSLVLVRTESYAPWMAFEATELARLAESFVKALEASEISVINQQTAVMDAAQGQTARAASG
jgi:hypothetical protein